MEKYADYIKQIEIDALWSGGKHVVWSLDRHVNILSGINGVGKTTILNKVLRHVTDHDGNVQSNLPHGVRVTLAPASATLLRHDIVRSMDNPVLDADTVRLMDKQIVSALDFRLYQLGRKYLNYQVDIGNRVIAALQRGDMDEARQTSARKAKFQDMVERLFSETGKTLVRDANELRFSQGGDVLTPYQLSSGEKQMLLILLTALTEDGLPYVLFMDEPEVSLHIEWQKQLIDLIMELNPNVQILLTTHSPAVIMNGWMDHVTEVSDITIEN